ESLRRLVVARLDQGGQVLVLERGEHGIAVGRRLLEQGDELRLGQRRLFLVVLVRRRGVALERRAAAELAERDVRDELPEGTDLGGRLERVVRLRHLLGRLEQVALQVLVAADHLAGQRKGLRRRRGLRLFLRHGAKRQSKRHQRNQHHVLLEVTVRSSRSGVFYVSTESAGRPMQRTASPLQ